MTKTTCQSQDYETCSDSPEMFRTEYIWGGRKRTKVECLTHAAESEQRGRKVEVDLTAEQRSTQAEWETAGIGTD